VSCSLVAVPCIGWLGGVGWTGLRLCRSRIGCRMGAGGNEVVELSQAVENVGFRKPAGRAVLAAHWPWG
jgi:hypothetical protein